jgi:Lrp/AsnC family transcriptional regulator for asnA, asnC and gidA
MRLDDLDRKILQSLSTSGRAPYSVIARELGSNEATIRKRVERLIRDGVVAITAVSNPYLLGFNTLVMIAVKVDLRKFDAVAEELSRMEELSFVACASGEYDIMVVAAFESDIDLYQFLTQQLANVDGVISSHTTHLLRLMRRTFSYRIPRAGALDGRDAAHGVRRPDLFADQGWDHPARDAVKSDVIPTRNE